jgi:O-succinylbenzoate synthase
VDHRSSQGQFATPICLDESILSPPCPAGSGDRRLPGDQHQSRAGWRLERQLPSTTCARLKGYRFVRRYAGDRCWTASNLALASLPGFTLPGDISASERYYVEDITHQRFTLNPDSTITVPNEPGLGVTVDYQALQHATLTSQTFP